MLEFLLWIAAHQGKIIVRASGCTAGDDRARACRGPGPPSPGWVAKVSAIPLGTLISRCPGGIPPPNQSARGFRRFGLLLSRATKFSLASRGSSCGCVCCAFRSCSSNSSTSFSSSAVRSSSFSFRLACQHRTVSHQAHTQAQYLAAREFTRVVVSTDQFLEPLLGRFLVTVDQSL